MAGLAVGQTASDTEVVLSIPTVRSLKVIRCPRLSVLTKVVGVVAPLAVEE